MKSYDKIPYWNQGLFDQDCIAFDKLDGSNFRAEFSKNKGWYKFGTRNDMIDKSNDQFGKGIDIFLDKYGDNIPRIIENKYKRLDNFVVFCEFFGPNSFAGWHDPNDKMDIVLFDVSLYKRGIIDPYEFIENFGSLDIPDIIYDGKYTNEFIESIRNNNFNLDEGVVCKGLIESKNKKNILHMTKIKTNSWILKVKEKMGINELIKELNGDKELIQLY